VSAGWILVAMAVVFPVSIRLLIAADEWMKRRLAAPKKESAKK
jgi:hypothetical protein